MQPFRSATLATFISAILGLATAIPAQIQARAPLIDAHKDNANLAKRYNPGLCSFAMGQYHSASEPYGIDVLLHDNAGSELIKISQRVDFNGNCINLTSQLPFVLVVCEDAGSDGLNFAYASQSWSSTDGNCNLSDWQWDTRDVGCSFQC